MLKLCLALPIFFPTFGGGPLRVLRSQPGLRKRDVQARVLAGTARAKDDFHAGERIDWSGGRIGSMLPVEHVEGTPVHRVRLPAESGVRRTAAYFRALARLCASPATRPDLIQLHSFERLDALFWLRRLRRLDVPIVYSIQIARPERSRPGLQRRLERLARHSFYERFDGIVTNSGAIRDALRDGRVRTPIEVVPNGVDLARFRRVDDPQARRRARAALGLRGDGPVVLAVGAISPRKGSDLVLEAWTRVQDRHPDAQLLFVGPRHDLHNPTLRPFARTLHRRIAESARPERVHLVGVRDDMNDVYAAADVVVLASSREGMPNGVIEAMACGRPVVLTPFLGQSAELGRAGREFRQSARTPEALATHLSALIEDETARAKLAREGERWARARLDLDTSLDRLVDFYQRAANGALTRPGDVATIRKPLPIEAFGSNAPPL